MEYASFVLRSGLALVFLSAVAGKATNMGAFSATLAALSVPVSVRTLFGWLLVAAELTTGVLLLAGPATLAVISSAILLAIFVGASVVAHRSVERIQCACFGRGDTELGMPTLARALLLGAMALCYWFVSLDVPVVWWPRSWDTAIPSLSLVAAMLVLGNWLFASPMIVRLVTSRRLLYVRKEG